MRSVVIRQGALGDFILTLPLLRALAQRGELHLVTPTRYRALLPEDLHVASFTDSDSAAAAALFAPAVTCHPQALPAPWAEMLRGAELHLFTRAAMLPPVNGGKLICHDPRPTNPPHAALQFLRNAGCDAPSQLLTTPMLPRSGQGRNALWIHSGSGSTHKNIPPDFWAAAAEERLQRDTLDLVLSFGEADMDLLEPMRAACQRRRLRWREVICPTLAELKCGLRDDAVHFWGADTGVAHLAAALGIPGDVWFRCTDPGIWRPLGDVSVHFYRK